MILRIMENSFQKIQSYIFSSDPDTIKYRDDIFDIFQGTWELNGNILTISDGTTEDSVEITVVNDSFRIPGEKPNAENLSVTTFIMRRILD